MKIIAERVFVGELPKQIFVNWKSCEYSNPSMQYAILTKVFTPKD